MALHENYTPFFKAKFLTKDSIETPIYYTFSESQISEFLYGSTNFLKHKAGAVLGLKTAIFVLLVLCREKYYYVVGRCYFWENFVIAVFVLSYFFLNTFCNNIYCAQLWCNFNVSSICSLHVCYNNILCRLLDLPQNTSISGEGFEKLYMSERDSWRRRSEKK